MQLNGVGEIAMKRIFNMYGTPVTHHITNMNPTEDRKMSDCYWFPRFTLYAGWWYDMPNCLQAGKYYNPAPRPTTS